MDREKEIVKQILETYDEISSIIEDGEKIKFIIQEKEYWFWYPSMNSPTESPMILVKNEEKFDYPHIVPYEIARSQDERYRGICLHGENVEINFMKSYEEKVCDAIERLLQLVSLSQRQVEREFQKEFLYYWYNMASNSFTVRMFFKSSSEFNKLNVYCDKNGNMRLVENGVRLNDAFLEENGEKLWKHNPLFSAYHIPIINKQGILPPTKDFLWSSKQIRKIIYGNEIDRISHATYLQLRKESVKSNNIVLVFSMEIESNEIFFTCILRFLPVNTRKPISLFEKLEGQNYSVEVLESKRVDYDYLSKQIGNDVSISSKKMLLVGAGSLGSYVAKEVVKTGVCNLTIYDKDCVEEENLLRHRVNGFWVGYSKVDALKYELESLHPQIFVKAIKETLTESLLKEEMLKYDIIIFTVGNSDVQLMANKVFREVGYDKPVIYVWLEAGGEYSHILSVDYHKEGCFECLFTNEQGIPVNNKANITTDIVVEKNTIGNGCGATRVKYGTTVLLRTTSVFLNVMRDVFEYKMKNNSLINIMPSTVENLGESFIERTCACCGNKNE